MSLTPRFSEALGFASQLHFGQERKITGTPYVSHLLSAAALVLEHGGTEDEAIAALLHDAVEDQGGRPTLETIRGRFGRPVADIVEACSDSETQPKPPWQQRKTAYIEKLAAAPTSVRLVVAADKLHNARCLLADYQRLGEKLWPYFTAGREGTLWYYAQVVDALLRHADSDPPGLRRLVAQLKDAVDALRFQAEQAAV